MPSKQVMTFFYGHYHSKSISTTTLDTAIFMRAWLENWTCYLPLTFCQSRLLLPLIACQRSIWLDPAKYATDVICKSSPKWKLTKFSACQSAGKSAWVIIDRADQWIYWMNLSCDNELLIIIQSIKCLRCLPQIRLV